MREENMHIHTAKVTLEHYLRKASASNPAFSHPDVIGQIHGLIDNIVDGVIEMLADGAIGNVKTKPNSNLVPELDPLVKYTSEKGRSISRKASDNLLLDIEKDLTKDSTMGILNKLEDEAIAIVKSKIGDGHGDARGEILALITNYVESMEKK